MPDRRGLVPRVVALEPPSASSPLAIEARQGVNLSALLAEASGVLLHLELRRSPVLLAEPHLGAHRPVFEHVDVAPGHSAVARRRAVLDGRLRQRAALSGIVRQPSVVTPRIIRAFHGRRHGCWGGGAA